MPTPAPVVLLDPTPGIVASAAGPAATGLGRYHGLFVGINVSGVPSGGTPTLDVYLQATPDGGATWQDVAAFRFTIAAARRLVQLSQVATPGTTTLAPSDGALASGTVVQGPFGDQLRVKYAFSAGGSTGGYTLGVTAHPNGGF